MLHEDMSVALCLISDLFRTSSIIFSWLGYRALVPGTVELALPTLIISRLCFGSPLLRSLWPQNLCSRMKNQDGHWVYC